MYSKIITFLFLFLAYVCLQGQENNILVEYSVTAKSGSTGVENFLKINSEVSLYGKLEKLNVDNEGKRYEIKHEDKTLYAVSKRAKLVFKNFKEKTVLSDERIVLDNFIVKDSLNIFKWKILKEEKIILGYNCRKAETHFRGRDYVAYFTSEILKPDGPWKLSGLPGLILEAFSKDQYVHFKAIDIRFNTFQRIENPFENAKIDFKNYIDFKNEYKKTYNELKKGKTRDDGRVVTSEIPKGDREIYID